MSFKQGSMSPPLCRSSGDGPLRISGRRQEPMEVSRISTTIDAEFWGVDPDKLDNQQQLWNMHDDLAARRDERHIVTFPKGLIRYTRSGWCGGLHDVEFIGYGTRLQNTLNSVSSIAGEKYPLGNGDFRQTDTTSTVWQGGGVYNSPNRATSYLVDTVSVGDDAISVKAGQSFPGVEAGDLVLLVAYDMQDFGGFPQNDAIFQYAYVSGYDGGTETVSLRVAAKYRFDEGFPLSGDHGGARLYICRSELGAPLSYWPHRLVLRGLTFLENPNEPTVGDNLDIKAEQVEIIDCVTPGIYVNSGISCIVKGGATSVIEVDKVIEETHVGPITRDSSLRTSGSSHLLSEATSLRRLYVTGQDFEAQVDNVHPLDLIEFRQCRFAARTDPGQEYNLRFQKVKLPTRSVKFVDPQFTALSKVPLVIVGSQFVVASAGTTGRNFLLDTAIPGQAEMMRLGLTYWTRDGRGGKLIELTGDGAGNVICRFDSADTYAPGDELFVLNVENLTFEGRTQVAGFDQAPLCSQFLPRRLGSYRPRSRTRETFVLTEADLSLQTGGGFVRHICRMTLDSISVNILSAAPSTATMQIQFDGATDDQFPQMVVNAETLGERMLNAGGVSGLQAGDALDNTVIGNFLHSIALQPKVGGGNGWNSINAYELPKFEIVLSGVVI